jgi:hypothetical protein
MSQQEEALTPDDASLKQQAIIAEYNSLRGEIAARSRDQLVCVTASLVGIGALFGTVAGNPEKFSGLLVVAPWILCIFGSIWCNHAHAVYLIAVYLREEIEQQKMPRLPGGTKFPPAISWETYIHSKRKKSLFLRSCLSLPTTFYDCGVGLLLCRGYLSTVSSAWESACSRF